MQAYEHPGLKAWDCKLGRASHSAQLSDLKDPALKGRVSSLEDQIDPFLKACHENNIKFTHSTRLDLEPTIDLISSSYMAPAIVGQWQLEKGYIPCRIFKNISYGALGITNSKTVYDLFEHKIVYNPDTYQLFYNARERLEAFTFEELYELMDFVKNKHTYINRIELLLSFFDLVRINHSQQVPKT